jgi:hypothetical protein
MKNRRVFSTKSLNYLKKIPEFYREVVKCWNLSGGGQTKSPVTFIDIRKSEKMLFVFMIIFLW